ncbi:helix-turn-helix transcriptional regulator [Clostridium sp.]|uniref:helix-turn-helix transcriptional regulator n=1 Tax=Clostridium sp. TaxID=1506 RepID=UPI0025C1D1C3|nr:helix-turn-helix transcriptional regulator [Clostridium sp.]
MNLIISEILDYIKINIFISDLKVEDIATHFGYDKYYFSSEFKKITGYSLNEYIISIKIRKRNRTYG